MFTGIVTDIGTVAARDGTKLKIASHYDPASLALGASVACDGCCLTVTRINLERPLSMGSELGGHLMTGHIDGLARILERKPDGDSAKFVLEAPAEFAQL